MTNCRLEMHRQVSTSLQPFALPILHFQSLARVSFPLIERVENLTTSAIGVWLIACHIQMLWHRNFVFRQLDNRSGQRFAKQFQLQWFFSESIFESLAKTYSLFCRIMRKTTLTV